MSVVFISKDKKNYDEWLLETVEVLRKNKIKSIAIVALLKDNTAITGYYNMGINEKVITKNEINFDIIDDFLIANKDRYTTKGDEDYEE